MVTDSAGVWSTPQLQLFDAAVELEVAARRPDGGLRRWTSVWVVRVGENVFVRSWYRRETGWFAGAVAAGRVRVRVPGLDTEAAVVDLGGASGYPRDTGERLRTQLFDDVDAAYRAKYGDYGNATVSAMVTEQARLTTLRLDPL